jgi:2-octaprenyl-6-methoxyphenol hydroxylase
MPARPAGRDTADVLVVGDGPVGLTLAVALAGAGLAVTVVGAASGAPRATGRPARAYALGAGTIALLTALGVWRRIAARAQPMRRVVVTDGRPGGTQLSLLEFGETAAGPSAHLVEEDALAAAIAEVAAGTQGLVRLAAGAAAALEVEAGLARVGFDGGVRAAAPLVVAADGRGSPVRRLAAIGQVGWDYGQRALVATVGHGRDHNGVAVERFFPAGPFAILPLTGKRSALVWTESRAEARRLVAAEPSEFAARLAERFGPERGPIVEIGPRATFPLSFHIARRFAGRRVALAGDAAHVVHPLAGQGLNLGFRDAAALAECVIDAARLGLDFGGPGPLTRYERWRRFDSVTAALAYDGLNGLFSNDRDGARAVRDLGLGLVERAPPLKRLLLREAAGRAGTLPRLMAGAAL